MRSARVVVLPASLLVAVLSFAGCSSGPSRDAPEQGRVRLSLEARSGSLFGGGGGPEEPPGQREPEARAEVLDPVAFHYRIENTSSEPVSLSHRVLWLCLHEEIEEAPRPDGPETGSYRLANNYHFSICSLPRGSCLYPREHFSGTVFAPQGVPAGRYGVCVRLIRAGSTPWIGTNLDDDSSEVQVRFEGR